MRASLLLWRILRVWASGRSTYLRWRSLYLPGWRVSSVRNQQRCRFNYFLTPILRVEACEGLAEDIAGRNLGKNAFYDFFSDVYP